MIQNLILTASRFFYRHKLYTFINLTGLSISLICAGLIAQYVKYEISHDQFQKHYHSIYRILSKSPDGTNARTPLPLATLLKERSDVKLITRIQRRDATVEKDDQIFTEDGIYFVEPDFHALFPFTILKGAPLAPGDNPRAILLTESMATKYFGNDDPLGKTIKIYQYDPDGLGTDYLIKGIVEDPPVNSHLQFNFLISFKTVENAFRETTIEQQWELDQFYTYLLPTEGFDKEAMAEQVTQIIQEQFSLESNSEFNLQPFSEIYLSTGISNELGKSGNGQRILFFSLIALLIVLMASINYINLATAYAAERTREVGIRKCLGAARNSLAFQFMTESVLLAFIAAGVAFLLIVIIQPYFLQFTGIPPEYAGLQFILLLFIFACLVLGPFSGIFPSILFTKIKSIDAMKGKFVSGPKIEFMRKLLIVFQFSVSIFLLIALLVIKNQIVFIESKDLGFEKNNRIMLKVNGSNEVIENFASFKNKLLQNPKFEAVARTNSSIGGGLDPSSATFTELPDLKDVSINTIQADSAFYQTFKIKIIEGSNAGNNDGNSNHVLVNETLVSKFGFDPPSQILGHTMEIDGTEYLVNGIVGDFHFDDLYQPIEPLVILPVGERFSMISVSSNVPVTQAVLSEVNKIWRQSFPQSAFDYRVLEESLSNIYGDSVQFNALLNWFSILSILISGLGLFGMSYFMLTKYSREVTVRKVFGASSVQLFRLLTTRFLLLILLANMIAWPAGWYFSTYWLDHFAFHIDLTLTTFVTAAFIGLLVAIGSVFYHTLKAVLVNPAQALRNE